MELRRRRLILFNLTEHPQAEWVVQQLRNLSVEQDKLPRFILRDRDSKFSEEFDAFAQGSGTEIIRLPARSPNLNAYAERWVRSVREGVRGVFYDTPSSPGLKQQTSDSREEPSTSGRVCCRQVLGGLINDYYREAA